MMVTVVASLVHPQGASGHAALASLSLPPIIIGAMSDGQAGGKPTARAPRSAGRLGAKVVAAATSDGRLDLDNVARAPPPTVVATGTVVSRNAAHSATPSDARRPGSASAAVQGQVAHVLLAAVVPARARPHPCLSFLLL